MLYKLRNIEIDSEKYLEKFAKRYYLPFMKELIEMSGCTLSEARDFIDKVIEEQNIKVDPVSKEMQDYLLSELRYEDE